MGALDIRPENARDPDREGGEVGVSCHWGHIRSSPSSLKCDTRCNLTSCPLGKLNKRFTVPSEMNAGHVRPRRCVEEEEEEEGKAAKGVTAAALPWNSDNLTLGPASWLPMMPLSNSINKPGWVLVVRSHRESHVCGSHREASPIHLVFVCMHTPMLYPLPASSNSYWKFLQYFIDQRVAVNPHPPSRVNYSSVSPAIVAI